MSTTGEKKEKTIQTKKKKIKNANNTLLNNQQIMEEIKICIETNESTTTLKPMEFSKSSAKENVHSNTSLPQETREKSNNITSHLKQLEKEELKNPRIRRKEIIKIIAEINEKEKKETLEKNQQN